MKSKRATASIIKTGRACALAIVLTVAVIVAGQGMLRPTVVSAAPALQTQSDMDMLKGLTGAQFEKMFLSMMIQHHMSAVDMSKYAAQNANHQEVKDAAQKIIAAQTQEIGEMTGWLRTWYNATPTPNAMGEMPGMTTSDMMNLADLKGDSFDKQFLTMMRMHHMSAVEMAQLVPGRATHQELKTLGQNIITDQTTEIKRFESWLMAWYNIDASQLGGMSGSMTGGMASGGATSGAIAPAGMPSTGAGKDSVLTPWLILAAALAGSAVSGGLALRKRSGHAIKS